MLTVMWCHQKTDTSKPDRAKAKFPMPEARRDEEQKAAQEKTSAMAP